VELTTERAGLVDDRDALADEIEELERRRNVAHLSYCSFANLRQKHKKGGLLFGTLQRQIGQAERPGKQGV
jgi:IS5 family transposase